jgi:hypothetical protein
MKDFAEKYRSATDEFLNLVNSLSEYDLDKSDSEGWTPRQVIHHMADSEAQSYARLRRLIAEPGTTIQGYDESKWAENPILNYKSEEIEVSLAVIRAVRQSSYELIKRITENELQNSGVHSESGNYSVKDWLETYTKHPIDHANQIKKHIRGEA